MTRELTPQQRAELDARKQAWRDKKGQPKPRTYMATFMVCANCRERGRALKQLPNGLYVCQDPCKAKGQPNLTAMVKA